MMYILSTRCMQVPSDEICHVCMGCRERKGSRLRRGLWVCSIFCFPFVRTRFMLETLYIPGVNGPSLSRYDG